MAGPATGANVPNTPQANTTAHPPANLPLNLPVDPPMNPPANQPANPLVNVLINPPANLAANLLADPPANPGMNPPPNPPTAPQNLHPNHPNNAQNRKLAWRLPTRLIHPTKGGKWSLLVQNDGVKVVVQGAITLAPQDITFKDSFPSGEQKVKMQRDSLYCAASDGGYEEIAC